MEGRMKTIENGFSGATPILRKPYITKPSNAMVKHVECQGEVMDLRMPWDRVGGDQS
jgi:hypothetical protein